MRAAGLLAALYALLPALVVGAYWRAPSLSRLRAAMAAVGEVEPLFIFSRAHHDWLTMPEFEALMRIRRLPGFAGPLYLKPSGDVLYCPPELCRSRIGEITDSPGPEIEPSHALLLAGRTKKVTVLSERLGDNPFWDVGYPLVHDGRLIGLLAFEVVPP